MPASAKPLPPLLSEITGRRLIFVGGKGGVGKTSVSQALALQLSHKKPTLWVTFEDPLRPPGELRRISSTLSHLNCDATLAFEEYVGLKLKVPALTKIFLQNRLMRYLSQAAPGVHELVLLGKVWHERSHSSHVVVDMPSTGYGLAMFQSAQNFAQLFRTGPLYNDAVAMLRTFGDPAECGHLIVGLPEDMPLRESLELDEFLFQLFPNNRAAFVVNRCFPSAASENELADFPPPDLWPTPFAADALDYARKRAVLEWRNLKTWSEAGVRYSRLDAIPPSEAPESVVPALALQLQERGWVP